MWQGFGSGGVERVASVRTFPKFPPCPTQPMPASSKMDPELAKAEPISDAGSPSGIMYLRWVEYVRNNSAADPKLSERGGRTQCSRDKRIPCSL